MTENKHADHAKTHGENAYSHQLKETLSKSLAPDQDTYPLQAFVDKIEDEELIKAFPFYSGADQVKRTKRWLKQELSKWRKTSPKKFTATLQKLYIYCVLTGLTPNDVLIPRESKPIILITEDYIKRLIVKLKSKDLPIKDPQKCYALPVILDVFNMSFGILHIFHSMSSTFGCDLIMQFSTTLLEPQAPNEKSCGLITAPFSKTKNITLASEEQCCDWATEVYQNLLIEFNSNSDYVHQGIQDFYSDIDGFSDEEMIANLMFSWYPPATVEPICEDTQKDFSSILSTHTSKSFGQQHER